MSGWDTTSTPSWGPQDDPEDGTRSFSASDVPPEDFSGGSDDAWSSSASSASPAPSASPLTGPGRAARQPSDDRAWAAAEESQFSSPPPEFFGQGFAKRQPGATLGRRDVPPWQEPARNELARSEPAWQDSERLDARRADYFAQPDQPDQAQQSPIAALSPDSLDREHASRTDPALQDFFTAGTARTDAQRQGPGQGPRGIHRPQGPGGTQPPRAPQPAGRQGPRLPDSGPQGWGQQRYAGNGGEQGTRHNGSNGSPWDSPAKRPMTGPLAIAMTGPMLAIKGAASLVTPKENEPLLTKVLRFAGIAAVVIAAAIAGVYLLTHSSGGSPNAIATTPANPQPTLGGATAAAKTPTSNSRAKTAKGAAARYVLSTPATAGGYPMGQDPHFLATAKSTARTVLAAVAAVGGGTAAKGSPVAASYMLPTNSQVVTFVGYRGTFDPAKVMTSMRSFGTTDGTYADTRAGDSIACANTTSSPSGGICVWATTTTIGITEFFSVSGPETLTASQYRGAAVTIKLRASVETKKS